MLTPVDIHNKEFKRGFRGYNMEEVDDFLDQVVNDYEKLYRENSQLKKEIELNAKQLDQYHQLEKNLQDTLLVAQRTAEEVTTTANQRADETRAAAKQAADNLTHEAEINSKNRITEATNEAKKMVDEATADSKRMIAEATAEADRTISEARAESKRMLDEASARVRQLASEYEHIVYSRHQFMAKMRNFLQTELDIVNDTESMMPDRKSSVEMPVEQPRLDDTSDIKED